MKFRVEVFYRRKEIYLVDAKNEEDAKNMVFEKDLVPDDDTSAEELDTIECYEEE
jgi:hypothetical protein